jgi:hypothetical protein
MIAAMCLDALVGAFSGRFVVPCDEGTTACDGWKRKRRRGGAPAAFCFLFRKEECYFFLPAGFFAAVFLPAAFVAVFFFAAICTSPDSGMNKSLLRFSKL